MNKFEPKVSLIIPLYVISERFFDDFKKYDELNYPNFEIIVVSDKKTKLPLLKNKVKLILTRKRITGPAEKRDLGIKYVSGNICAFIDDDAYPNKDWLKNAVMNFKDKKIVGVGGSGITPKEDNFLQKLSGLVYESVFISWGFQERFIISKKKKVVDWPAYNLLVRTKALKEVGGYGNFFYGGEDTFLCLKLIDKGSIIYEPKAYVYHHRRALFLPHLHQIMNVGIHRGYFARVFPKTSRAIIYFMPSILTAGLLTLLVLSLYSKFMLILLLISFSFFLIIGFLSALPKTHILGALLTSLGIILTHIVYGIGFIKGFTEVDLKT